MYLAKKVSRKIVLYVILLLSINFIAIAQKDSVNKLIDFQTRKFRAILENLYEYSIDSVDIHSASDAAFKAMLKHINDKNDYYPKTVWRKFFNSNQGKKESIGLTLQVFSDTVFVLDIDKNSPAEKSGIKRGNVILEVDGVAANANNYKEVQQKMYGNEGDTVSIKYLNYKSLEIKQAELIYKKYQEPSLSTFFILPKEKMAYIKIKRFSTETPKELKALESQIRDNKINEIIIDLRDNGGGTLDASLKIINNFIASNDTIFKSYAKKKEFKYDIVATQKTIFEKNPIIVLINENTASASEVFAGAIQDLDRGIIIGENSFGKGTIQKTWNLIDTTGYKITVARFVTPTGRAIEKSKQKNNDLYLDPELKLSNPKLYADMQKKIKNGDFPLKYNIYNTKRKKRPIIEQGGIRPDIRCTKDTITLLTDVLVSKGIILEFLFKNTNLIPSNYQFNDFLFNYEVSDELLQKLKEFSYNIKKTWNEEMFVKDKEVIRNRLKANIAHYLWGMSAYYAVIAFDDNIMETAIKNRAKAKEIME